MAEKKMSPARSVRLRTAGLHVDALNDTLKARVAELDEDEIAVLASVKAKLNSQLDTDLGNAADTVGGFVW